MSDNVIHPTNTCFDDALEMMEHFIAHDRRRIDTLVLVHAICLKPDGPEEGEPFAHAWLEEGDRAWSAGVLRGVKIQYSCELASFLEQLRVQDATRYTAYQANEENKRSRHYGPWVERYEQLCRDSAQRAAS